MEKAPRIDSVQPVGLTSLLIGFRNGEQRLYDCEPLLARPQFGLLMEPAFFRATRVDAGG